jgi:hypothetical protein
MEYKPSMTSSESVVKVKARHECHGLEKNFIRSQTRKMLERARDASRDFNAVLERRIYTSVLSQAYLLFTSCMSNYFLRHDQVQLSEDFQRLFERELQHYKKL